MMGRIYEQAETVKIWLGKGDAHLVNLVGPSHIGRYGVMPVVLSFIAQALRNIQGGRNRLASLKTAEDSVNRNMAYGFPAPSASEWDVMRGFFSNPWFQRVWVVQEAVLGKQAVVILGDWEIRWSALGQAALWFQNMGYAIPPPVDKVYAAFGLAAETRQFVDAELQDGELYALIKPDYNQSTKNAYRNVALFLIEKHRNLLVLSHAGETQTVEQSSWPSWVPDWCYEKAAMAFSSSCNLNAYNADSDEPLRTDTLRTETSGRGGDAITLHGIQADVIEAYGDQLTSYGFGFKTYQEERDFVKAAWNLLAKRPQLSYGTGADDTFHTFILTLTAGPSNESTSTNETSSFLNDAKRWFVEHLGNRIATVSMAYRIRLALSGKVDSGRFHQAFVRACMDRRFFLTKDDRMGIGPRTMKEGDIIAVLFGGKVPFVLRPLGTRYRFIGECYVPGLMKGEAVEQWRAGSFEPEIFELY
ncbi:uncharacterized protein BDZ99DRAFT_390923 [Mytilinidion resinicola]|uniref:Heterokaryon incompatibility domain-containing protein n=1 Tax=Mytilinidion resinicola TaxID=574789 RepID=A0A6A6YIB6_9PEZI|nr:uncharacterized protein BDZ99DRAFT_390923 [Mytilinidion resinicola]KAF2808586.1 hypothetical protein BDZ99DRAFT_390923 [Mytilinidion resinicola]